MGLSAPGSAQGRDLGKPLEITALEGRSSVDFLEAAFRAYDDGRVFAIVRPGLDLSRYPGLSVAESVDVGARLGWARLSHAPRADDAPAQVVFTSGTEGAPKPIVLSHRNLADVVARLNAAMEVDDAIREYVGVPVTYSFGLGRARAVAAAGGEIFLPERFDPAEIRAMLEAGEINAVSAVPSLWRLVLAAPDAIGPAGEAVRWIEIGSQYMSCEEKEAMKRLFPNARIVQHYGLTEASRTTFLDVSATEGEALESVGAATGAAAIELGEDDAIRIRGDHVALGLLGSDGAIAPIADAEGWLQTKDRGAIRDGRLWYLGRLDDQINVAGVKTSAERVEREIRELAGGAGEFAVVPVPDPLRGDRIVLALTSALGDRAPLMERAAEIALRRLGVAQAGPLETLRVEALPVTGTGKVRRRALREAYEAEERPAAGSAGDAASLDALAPAERRIAEIWAGVVGRVPIGPDASFYDLGGDSLTSVQIGLAMEQAKIARPAVRATMEGRTLREVAALAEGGEDATSTPALPRQTAESWSISAVRGIMVLSVLLSHWAPGVFERLDLVEAADRLLSVVYRMGTPGFAAVFGVGLGYFMLPGYPENRASVARRLRLALVLVASGLLLRGLVVVALHYLEGRPLDGYLLAVSFYNILGFYVLAIATAPLWLRFLSSRSSPALAAVPLALALFALWRAAAALAPDQLSSLLEWPRLMLVANYSYLRLMGFTLIGVAIGYGLARSGRGAPTDGFMIMAGGVGIVVAAMIALQVYGPTAFTVRQSPFFTSHLGALFYVAIAVLLIGAAARLIAVWDRLPHLVLWGLRLLIVTGGLALPVYAFHSIVIPVKDILALMGVPGAIALLIPMTVFLGSMGYAGLRLYRTYFS